jgi:hypothetical protein
MKKGKKREKIKNRKIPLNNKTTPPKWDFLKMEINNIQTKTDTVR